MSCQPDYKPPLPHSSQPSENGEMRHYYLSCLVFFFGKDKRESYCVNNILNSKKWRRQYHINVINSRALVVIFKKELESTLSNSS